MKINLLGALLLSIVAVLPAHALSINLTSYAPPPASSGNPFIEDWLSNVVSGYNAANNPDLPAPGDELFRQNKTGEGGSFGVPGNFPAFGNGTLSIAIPGGYEYIALHWGGPNGGTYQAFYVGGTDNVFNAPGQNGLSWYDGFVATPGTTSAPDSGTTLTLLACSLVALAAVRRRQVR